MRWSPFSNSSRRKGQLDPIVARGRPCRVEAVFGLVEHDAAWRLEDLVRDLEAQQYANRAEAPHKTVDDLGDLYVDVPFRRIRCSGAKTTTCTWSFRWRYTKPRSAPASRCRHPRTARLARAAGHAVGPAVSHPRARRALAAVGHRGDLVVEIRLALPKLLDERSKVLLRQFGRI